MDFSESAIEYADRIVSRYPAILPKPVSADMAMNKELPPIVPVVSYRFGIIGRIFDIVRTEY